MIEAFIISTVLLLVGVLLLGYRVFFIKEGEFPNIHIGGSKLLKERGISCATTQDRDARKKTKSQTSNQVMEDLINNF